METPSDNESKQEPTTKPDTQEDTAQEAPEKDTDTDTAEAEEPEKVEKAKPEHTADKKAKAPKENKPMQKVTMPIYFVAIIVAVCLVVGGLVGHYALGGVHSLNVTAVSENQLDTPIARYNYNGQHNVTVRDVISQTSSLDSAKNDDGTYRMPTAGNTIDTARTQILQDIVQQRNIQVSDDELDQYAQQYLGTNDYSQIASRYNMDEDAVKNVLRQSAALTKLRDQVVTDVTLPAQPTAPSQPADGQQDTPTQDYATYIINLAGDEWDSDNNTWKDSNSDYAQALTDYTITNDSATYAAAQAAYYVAYQKYASARQQMSSEWTNFVNGELSKASIQVYTLEA